MREFSRDFSVAVVMPEGSTEELPSSQACGSQVPEPAGLLAPRSSRTMVTGGGGYLGYNLGCALVSSGIAVVLFDVRKPKWEIPSGADFFKVCWSCRSNAHCQGFPLRSFDQNIYGEAFQDKKKPW